MQRRNEKSEIFWIIFVQDVVGDIILTPMLSAPWNYRTWSRNRIRIGPGPGVRRIAAIRNGLNPLSASVILPSSVKSGQR